MAVNFIRWNATSHIYELSTNDGASFAALPLNASIINEGILAKARQHGQTAYKDESNVFTVNQAVGSGSGVLTLTLNGGDGAAEGAYLVLQQNSSTQSLIGNHSAIFGSGSLNDLVLYTNIAGLPLRLFSGGVEGINITDGLVTLPTGQLKFPATANPSTNANTFDDYEEGDFTPGLQFGGGSTGMTFSAQLGSYVKLGRLVIISGLITLTAKGSSTGNALITGLPFNIGNANKFFGSLKFNYNGFTAGVLSPGYQSIVNSATLNTTKDATGVNTVMTHADYTNSSAITLLYAYMVD